MRIRNCFIVAGVVVTALQAAATGYAMGLGTAPDTAEPSCACAQSAIIPSGHDNLVDINSAPKDWLMWVGIDDALAAKIINERPYQAAGDLVTRGILPPATYDKIKDRIIARRV